MPHEQMDQQQVAQYLHIDIRELEKLSSRGLIPCRKVKDRFVYRKGAIDQWIESQMHRMDRPRLRGIARGVDRHHGFVENQAMIRPLIPPGGVICPLKATSRDSVLRSLVKAAADAGLVYAKDELLAEIKAREQLCTTALIPGVALPHPRHPLPYDIEASFIIVGLTASGIPFGSADGLLTRLFFLICCKDDRTHLHVLARIGLMLHDPGSVDDLLTTESAQELGLKLQQLEQKAIEAG